MLVALCTAAASSADVSLDVAGAVRKDASITGSGGQELWRLNNVANNAGITRVTSGGYLVFGGQSYSEATATTTRKGLLPTGGYVFETKFTFSRPPLFLGDMVFISPRMSGDGKTGYRIGYRFLGATKVSWNQVGFYLFNTGVKDPKPIAGKPYSLVYGREYTAYCVVQDVPTGVHIQFYLHNPAYPADDAKPLFDFIDTSADRIGASDDSAIQIGTGGVVLPATPVSFRDMKVYHVDELASSRAARKDDPDAAPPDGTFPVPQPPAATELANFFSDNMVLQRDKPMPIWGHGIEGDQIHVALAGKQAISKVTGGIWKVILDPITAGGPYVLTVQGKDKTLEVKNVLIGDLWVLGGQSNMSYWLKGCTNDDQEIAQSDCPWLRIFSSWHPSAAEAQFHVQGSGWKVVTRELGGQYSAVGYFFARAIHDKLNIPIGLVDTSCPATQIEVWMSPQSASTLFTKDSYGQYPAWLGTPSALYNGSVAPVMPSAITGILWYQGDGSDAGTGLAYRKRIPALIDGWRQGFGQGDVPFFVVQIPRFNGCSPEMRESDLLGTMSRPNTGVAVVLDIGEADNIHPHNKKPVGERLSLIAKALTYGEKIEYMGPTYHSMQIKDGKAYVSFDHASSGLVLKADDAFEICGADGKYVKASAEITPDNRLAVWSADVPQPTAVRYAWANFPNIGLYNKDGLLASPFRTDVPEAK